MALGVLLASAGAAQELPFQSRPGAPPPAPSSALESVFEVESVLNDAATERYLSARRDEEAAWQVLREATGELDRAMTQASFGVEELRLLDLQVAELRERALLASRHAADLRRELLTQLERVAALGSALEIERQRPALTNRFSGTWEITIASSEERGLFVVELEGSLVTGRYSFGEGSRGSLVGSLVGALLRLERIDDESGRDMIFEGLYDPGDETITGTWNRRELALGLQAGGDFTARKLSAEEVAELEEELAQEEPEADADAGGESSEETEPPSPW